MPRAWFYGILLGLLFMLFSIARGPIYIGIKKSQATGGIQAARTIALAMFQYANDNEQKYPDGKSSTEVFQKLIDGGYISDPTIFYISLPGKTRAVASQKLQPENVSFDVTGGTYSNSPDELPIVFMTGYKVTYAPGGSAVPIIKPYPQFGVEPNERLDSMPPGIVVCYKSNSAKFMNFNNSASVNRDGSISNFVPPDFKPDGKTYRQLTPDGVLP
jgi:hypothetical protein